MRVHFIAVGGAVMHNLALALHDKGFRVTGSDDEIVEPSRGRLQAAGLLPDRIGWDPGRIDEDLDAVILGMHARADNPELRRALEQGIPVYSFPEYMYLQTREKTRVVVAGSHGKTTVTSLILHALRLAGRRFDYLVGATLEGFSTMVGLKEASDLAVFEGDEYPASALDRRPKFLLYRPHIALITGIAWDHINVFPTFEAYRRSFEEFAATLEPGSTLVYYAGDPELVSVAASVPPRVRSLPYQALPYRVDRGRYELLTESGPLPVPLIGHHNMENLAAARTLCSMLGLSEEEFLRAAASYPGAARRLNLVAQREDSAVYLDFAHAPSKVRATTRAVKTTYPERRLTACLELHTFSSLTASFLAQYRGSLESADEAVVYFDPHTVEHKKLAPLDPAEVAAAFGGGKVKVVTRVDDLVALLSRLDWQGRNLLLMSSGTFSGLDVPSLASRLLGNSALDRVSD